MAPTEADRSNDLEDGWAGEAVASGKHFMMKLTIALTVGGAEVSSASLSSREGEEGWLGEDLEWGLPWEPLFGEEASLEECGLGECDSLERGLLEELGPASGANPIRLGEDDPFEAKRLWGDEGDRREANRS